MIEQSRCDSATVLFCVSHILIPYLHPVDLKRIGLEVPLRSGSVFYEENDKS